MSEMIGFSRDGIEMCLGIPVRVLRMEGTHALCEGRDGEIRVDTLLVGDVDAGSWLLTYLGAAREVINETRARQINRALDGLQAVLGGSADFDGFFEDLAGREPQLPPHLQAQLNKEDA